MAGGEESPAGVLQQKVWVLKASIHCEGCKKKIKKILSKVPGVSVVEIDAPRKTIKVTGIVEGDALVNRLAKYNKHAELLNSNADTAADRPKEETASKEIKKAAPEEKAAAAAAAAAAPATADKNADAGGAPAAEPAKVNAKAEKKSDKKAAAPPEGAGAVPASTKGEAKTEEKKAPKDDAGAAARSRDLGDMYPYPMHQPQPNYGVNYNAAQPNYGVSYNVAQPSASQAYYAPAMPTAAQAYPYYAPAPAPQGYAYYPYAQYPQPQYASPPPEFYYYGSAADGGSSSQHNPVHNYDTLFSEENPNGCSIM